MGTINIEADLCKTMRQSIGTIDTFKDRPSKPACSLNTETQCCQQ